MLFKLKHECEKLGFCLFGNMTKSKSQEKGLRGDPNIKNNNIVFKLSILFALKWYILFILKIWQVFLTTEQFFGAEIEIKIPY